MSHKSFDRGSLRTWTEAVEYHENQAKFWFNIRHTWTRKQVGSQWEDATPEEAYAYCRTRFNLERQQVHVNRRRLARAAARYLKNYKGK